MDNAEIQQTMKSITRNKLGFFSYSIQLPMNTIF